MTEPDHATVSTVGDGETYWTGFPNTIRIPGEETGGAFTVIELRVPPGFSGPPHIHHNEHQTDHVVEGELVFTVGEETIVADAGTIVHCPRDVPHSFRNESESDALVYDWLHPAGFDEFMARSTPRVTDPSNPPEADMDRVMELAPEYGVEFFRPDDEDAGMPGGP